MQAKKRHDKDIEIKDLHCSLRMPGDPENQAPETQLIQVLDGENGFVENLLISLRETDPIVKRGLLLTYVGETTNDIFHTLPSTSTDYAAAVESLTQRFNPSTNKDMEIYEFRQITQESGETINEFYRRWKEKSSSCEFTNAEAEIRTQIIHKTSDNRLRRKALRKEMVLKALLMYGLTLEQSDRHSKLLEEDHKTSRQTNLIGGKKKPGTPEEIYCPGYKNTVQRTRKAEHTEMSQLWWLLSTYRRKIVVPSSWKKVF